jgi:hypothetical protein
VDVNPFGPLQFQDPPINGCGPRFTLSVAFTVTVEIVCQAPPFTWMFGRINGMTAVCPKAPAADAINRPETIQNL